MKKLLALFCVASMVLSLSACGGVDNTETSEHTTTAISGTDEAQSVEMETQEYRHHIELSDVYDAILAEQPTDLEPLVMFAEDGYSDLVQSLYPDMARFDYNQMVLYAPPVTGFPCEIMMVEAKYEEDADHAEDVFLERIENGAADDTYPENAEGWMLRAEVQRDGFYVAMIVLPEGYEIPNNVFYLVGE